MRGLRNAPLHSTPFRGPVVHYREKTLRACALSTLFERALHNGASVAALSRTAIPSLANIADMQASDRSQPKQAYAADMDFSDLRDHLDPDVRPLMHPPLWKHEQVLLGQAQICDRGGVTGMSTATGPTCSNLQWAQPISRRQSSITITSSRRPTPPGRFRREICYSYRCLTRLVASSIKLN